MDDMDEIRLERVYILERDFNSRLLQYESRDKSFIINP